MGSASGRRGLSAPGGNIISLGADSRALTFGGTSATAPFVAGEIALLWSQFPTVTAAQVKFAVTGVGSRRATIVPPLLDAWRAYQFIKSQPEEVNTVNENKIREADVNKDKHRYYRVRLPGFISDEEVGFGDAIKRATSSAGIRPCGGCGRRAAALNRWLTFSGRR
jgi:hypothetical protein